jgi:hypothetical protein
MKMTFNGYWFKVIDAMTGDCLGAVRGMNRVSCLRNFNKHFTFAYRYPAVVFVMVNIVGLP